MILEISSIAKIFAYINKFKNLKIERQAQKYNNFY